MRHAKAATLVLVLSLLGAILTSSCQAGEEDTRKDFERLAGQFKFFCGGEFLFDSPPESRVPAAMLPEYQKLLDEVTASKHETSALLALLKHNDPRVRTLAIAALCAKEDPQVLPRLAEMRDDTAVTFPLPDPFVQFDFARDKLPPLQERQVGRLASIVVGRYLEFAGERTFDAYWAARKGRTFCASWFSIQLERAGSARVPTPASRVKRVNAVWERIDNLSKADRAWTLLWLEGENAPYFERPSEEKLIEACKDLGPDRLLEMLRRKIPSDDPDVQPRPDNNSQYKNMQYFVLARADKLLRPKDAQALLAYEREEWDFVKNRISDPMLTSQWSVAAAKLQPEHAKEWLHEAMTRYDGQTGSDRDNRADIAEALWRLVGPDETEYLVNWFYEQEPERGQYPNSRARFLQTAAPLRGRAGRKLVADLVRDKRLETLDWQSLKTLIGIVNDWVEKPVVDPAAIVELESPVYLPDFYWEQEKARKEHPKETAELLKTFAEWGTALRDSIPKWSK